MKKQDDYNDYNVVITWCPEDNRLRIYYKNYYECENFPSVITSFREGYASIQIMPIWNTEEVIWYE